MLANQTKKAAPGVNLGAVLNKSTDCYFKRSNKKITPVFPVKANPLFCTFDRKISEHINKVAFCFFMQHVNYCLYDLSFSNNKEVWVFYLDHNQRELSKKLGYALLRQGALKVQILFFPVGGMCYAE